MARFGEGPFVGVTSLASLSPATYRAHSLHGSGAEWAETNCYVDLYIGLLHGLGLEPAACLGFTVCADFEDDQWTFFKPPHADLRSLYGLQIEEMGLWRSALEHCVEHVRAGRVPLIEADSFYLPDTRATDYRRTHVKTTIAPVFVDPDARRMRYFHNTGFYELVDEDFDAIFRFKRSTGSASDVTSAEPHWLPPYCELAKISRVVKLAPQQLAARAVDLLRRHLDWRPATNPFERFARRWPDHQGLLLAGDLGTYHSYSFATLRQCGACYGLLSAHLDWLSSEVQLDPSAARAFLSISQTSKAMLMKLARVVNSGKPRDFSDQFQALADDWDAGMGRLEADIGQA
jgi:hypothetical protein